jgi:hypothetical protein
LRKKGDTTHRRRHSIDQKDKMKAITRESKTMVKDIIVIGEIIIEEVEAVIEAIEVEVEA